MSKFLIAKRVHNAMVEQITAAIDAEGAGTIKVYSGAQSTTTEDAPPGRLLAELTFSQPSFKRAVDGTIVCNLVKGAVARESGKAAWARLADGAGRSVIDCDVGTVGSAAAIKLTAVDILQGGQVEIDSIVMAMPRR